MLNFKMWIMREMANGNPMGSPEEEIIPVQAVPKINKKDLPPTSGKRSPTELFDKNFKSILSGKGSQK
jgi:hypothetical protein